MGRLLDENQLIRKIERAFPAQRNSSIRLALGDDAALWSPESENEVVLTSDWSLEGSHFLRDKHPAEAVGWKCLARAVSDIAAMGGVPRCFLLSLALPGAAAGRWLSEFLRGLRRASRALGCELAGGDTTRRNEILINVAVIGEVHRGRAVRRSGAKPGDQLFVTGTLGEAELGLRLLRREAGRSPAKNAALQKHLYPVPRLAIGQWMAEKNLVTAMLDLSDGLSTDLARLCAANAVGARINTAELPVTSLVGRREGLSLALHGGDDYELLFAVSPGKAEEIPPAFGAVSLTRIGEIVAGKKIVVDDGVKLRVLAPGGWDPFRKN